MAPKMSPINLSLPALLVLVAACESNTILNTRAQNTETTLPDKIPEKSPACELPTETSTISAVSKWGVGDRTYLANMAGTYTWKVPEGWTIIRGQETQSIDVTVPVGGATGEITATVFNSCGNGPSSRLSVDPIRPGVISTAAGLAAVKTDAASLAASYELAIDIDLTGVNWEPIGTSAMPFSGVLNGKNHTVSNLTIDRPTTNNLGLFGAINDGGNSSLGIVSKLKIDSVRINQDSGGGTVTTNHAGALAGEVSGTISDIVVSALIKCSTNCGGLAGYSDGIITNSGSSGTVIALNGTAAGLVGDHRGIIRRSRAKTNVSTPTRGGGLVGLHYPNSSRHSVAEVVDSYATGDVTQIGTPTETEFGGLVARADNSVVKRSYATGIVTATIAIGHSSGGAGGLIGNILHSSIKDSFATGRVIGDLNVGGLVGLLTNNTSGVSKTDSESEAYNNSTIERCFATGNVSGSNSVGGLVGRQRGLVKKSFSTGNVFGGSNAGGLIGLHYGQGGSPALAEDSYSTGSVSQRNTGGLSSAGSFAGRSDNGIFTRTYATGGVGTGTNVGGFVGSVCCGNTFTGSFWNIETTGQATSPAGGAGKTSAELLNPTTFAAWNLTTIWSAPNGSPPLLRSTPWDYLNVWAPSVESAPSLLKWESVF